MNLEQIAKLSGVSRSTVSRVINNDPNVSDATREKMRHADDDLPLAAHTNPPLTTLRQPIHRSGVMAVELLIELIEQPVQKLKMDEVAAAREHGEHVTFLAGIGVRPFRVSRE